MSECIVCHKELDGEKDDICDSCSKVLSAKYPKKTKFREVIKCHRRNAKMLRE